MSSAERINSRTDSNTVSINGSPSASPYKFKSGINDYTYKDKSTLSLKHGGTGGGKGGYESNVSTQRGMMSKEISIKTSQGGTQQEFQDKDRVGFSLKRAS